MDKKRATQLTSTVRLLQWLDVNMLFLSALSSLRARTLEMRFLSRSLARSPCCFIVPRAGRSRARMIGKRVHALFTAFIDDQGASQACAHAWFRCIFSSAVSHSGMHERLFCFSPTSCSAHVAAAMNAPWFACVCGCMEMEENRTASLTHLLFLVSAVFILCNQQWT
jgi:hypothetical protein